MRQTFGSFVASFERSVRSKFAIHRGWRLVAATFACAAVTKLFGYGSIAMLALILGLQGVVFCGLLSWLPSRGSAKYLLPITALFWITIALIVSFLILTATAFAFSFPCGWTWFLELRGARCYGPPALSMTIGRDSEFSSGTGCVNNKRILNETTTDHLEFSETITDYYINVRRSPKESDSVIVEYEAGGKVHPASLEWAPTLSDLRQSRWRVPVKHQAATVIYHVHRELDKADDTYGPSFDTTLPVSALYYFANAPDHKTVTGASNSDAFDNLEFRRAGCTFQPGSVPTLECKKPLKNTPNVPMTFGWKWNVFEGC